MSIKAYDRGSVTTSNTEFTETITDGTRSAQENSVGYLLENRCKQYNRRPRRRNRLTLIPILKPKTIASKSRMASKCGLQTMFRGAKIEVFHGSRIEAKLRPVIPINVSIRYRRPLDLGG